MVFNEQGHLNKGPRIMSITKRILCLGVLTLGVSGCIYDRMAEVKSDMRALEAECLSGDSPQACEMYRYKQAELESLHQRQRQAWQDIGQGLEDIGGGTSSSQPALRCSSVQTGPYTQTTCY